jgi:hypothetical protein
LAAIGLEEKLGGLLIRLLNSQGSLLLSWTDQPTRFSATLTKGDKTSHHETDEPLLLLQSMLGTVKFRVCPKCKAKKPLTAFSRGGRAGLCMACERERTKSRGREDRVKKKKALPG